MFIVHVRSFQGAAAAAWLVLLMTPAGGIPARKARALFDTAAPASLLPTRAIELLRRPLALAPMSAPVLGGGALPWAPGSHIPAEGMRELQALDRGGRSGTYVAARDSGIPRGDGNALMFTHTGHTLVGKSFYNNRNVAFNSMVLRPVGVPRQLGGGECILALTQPPELVAQSLAHEGSRPACFRLPPPLGDAPVQLSALPRSLLAAAAGTLMVVPPAERPGWVNGHTVPPGGFAMGLPFGFLDPWRVADPAHRPTLLQWLRAAAAEGIDLAHHLAASSPVGTLALPVLLAVIGGSLAELEGVFPGFVQRVVQSGAGNAAVNDERVQVESTLVFGGPVPVPVREVAGVLVPLNVRLYSMFRSLVALLAPASLQLELVTESTRVAPSLGVPGPAAHTRLPALLPMPMDEAFDPQHADMGRYRVLVICGDHPPTAMPSASNISLRQFLDREVAGSKFVAPVFRVWCEQTQAEAVQAAQPGQAEVSLLPLAPGGSLELQCVVPLMGSRCLRPISNGMKVKAHANAMRLALASARTACAGLDPAGLARAAMVTELVRKYAWDQLHKVLQSLWSKHCSVPLQMDAEVSNGGRKHALGAGARSARCASAWAPCCTA